MSLFNELKRRNVFKAGFAYIVMAWLVIQVADVILNNITAPAWIFHVLLLFLAAGLPFVVFFAWVFELTPQGLKKETEIDRSGDFTPVTGRKLDFAIIGLLLLALSYFGYDKFVLDPSRDAALVKKTLSVTELAGVKDGSEDVEDAHTSERIELLDERPAIAVLPFDNLSPDPEHAFFADGLAEDLITSLSSWRAFPVIARNSSFQYRGGNMDLGEISEVLGVRYIVQGSVRRVGDRIRVSAQLINATTGEHVWADTYDRQVEDVFAMQDEISAMIAAPLVGDLNRAEAERAHQRSTENLEAWSLYQLGMQHFDRYTREDLKIARETLTLATQRDPRFATAMAQLSMVSLWEIVLGWNDRPGETIVAALELTRRAASIDPRDPATQAALGWAYLMSGDLNNGLDAARRAVDLNPSMPEAWGWLSWALLIAEDNEASIAAAERTQRLNPRGAVSSIVYDNLSQAYWQMGRYEEGLEAAHRLLAELPDYFLGHVFIAMNAVGLGRLDEARAAIADGLHAQPNLSLELVQGIYGVARPETDARRNSALRQAGLE